MPTKPSENPEYYEYADVPSDDVRELMNDEINSAPRAPGELREKFEEHNAVSPLESGGDVDADWDDAHSVGEVVGGHNPTPDQSDVETNAHAMGVDFQDNEPLDLLEKMEKRDRNRFELDENSKEGDMI
jgi:hypothetical protein